MGAQMGLGRVSAGMGGAKSFFSWPKSHQVIMVGHGMASTTENEVKADK